MKDQCQACLYWYDKNIMVKEWMQYPLQWNYCPECLNKKFGASNLNWSSYDRDLIEDLEEIHSSFSRAKHAVFNRHLLRKLRSKYHLTRINHVRNLIIKNNFKQYQ